MENYHWIPDEELLTVLYSLTVSVFAIGGMTGALLVGRLVTKYGRLVCVSVSVYLCMFVSVFWRARVAFVLYSCICVPKMLSSCTSTVCEFVCYVSFSDDHCVHVSKQERDSGAI